MAILALIDLKQMLLYPAGQYVQAPDVLFETPFGSRLQVLLEFVALEHARLLVHFMDEFYLFGVYEVLHVGV